MGRLPDMILAVDGSRIVRHRKQSKVERVKRQYVEVF